MVICLKKKSVLQNRKGSKFFLIYVESPNVLGMFMEDCEERSKPIQFNTAIDGAVGAGPLFTDTQILPIAEPL